MLIRSIKLLLIAVALMLLAAVFMALLGFGPRTSASVAIIYLSAAVLSGICVVAVAWMLAAATVQRRRTGTILAYVEQAVRMNLPLPRIFRAIAESEPGELSQRVNRAAVVLEQGEPLAAALEQLPRLPGRIIGLVAAAERVGRLPQVLARIIEQRRRALVRGMGWMPFYRIYPLIFGIIFVIVTSMVMVFVIPKYEKLLKGFHTEMPLVTQWSLSIARGSGPWIALLLIVIMLAAVFGSIASRWRGAAYGLIESPGTWLANRLPWIGSIRMQRALGDVFDFAADAVDSGRSIDQALLEASTISSNSRLRGSLRQWVDSMTRGMPIADAARSAGMPPLVCGMLATAVNTPDLSPVLQFLGRYYSTRFSRAVLLLQASAVPAIAITLGFFVLWLAVTVFAPLVTLIVTLSSPSMRMRL